MALGVTSVVMTSKNHFPDRTLSESFNVTILYLQKQCLHGGVLLPIILVSVFWGTLPTLASAAATHVGT